MKIALRLLAFALLLPVVAVAQDKPAPVAEAPKVELHTYRLTYTLTETESGKRIGLQHMSMTASPGTGAATVKIGSKIPISTGGYTNGDPTKPTQYQMTYVDVGLNIMGRLRDLGYGIELTTKIEQSSMADAPPATPANPIIRQTGLENNAIVTPGKPVVLGSLDIPGSARHMEVEVVVERVP